MTKTVISVENLSKFYRLGQIGTGTLSRDLEIWLAKIRDKPNPYLKIGQTDPSELDGETLWALRDVSFQVQQGEVLGIIGRNGAGKSTLLKILSRVTAPTSGKVKVKGRIASLLEVGTGFHPELTGRENIFLNGAILGMSKQEVQRKFDEIVNFAEIEKFVDTPVKRYSSGMYVRLAFAVAAHLESEILLVDEVLAVGDAEFQKKCLGKMGDVSANEGRTVFFVSHNMAAIKQLSSRCVVLSDGSIKFIGSSNKSIDFYLENSYTTKNDSTSQETFNNPNNTPHIKKILFLNTDRKAVRSIKTGDDLIIKLVFFSREISNDLIVTLGINDLFGTRITVLHSKISGYSLCKQSENSTINCQLSNVNLLPGKYSLDIKIYNINEPIFWAPNFTDLIIEQGDFFGSGKLPPKEWGGYFICDQKWYQ